MKHDLITDRVMPEIRLQKKIFFFKKSGLVKSCSCFPPIYFKNDLTKTSQLICITNPLTCFYTAETLELNKSTLINFCL